MIFISFFLLTVECSFDLYYNNFTVSYNNDIYKMVYDNETFNIILTNDNNNDAMTVFFTVIISVISAVFLVCLIIIICCICLKCCCRFRLT